MDGALSPIWGSKTWKMRGLGFPTFKWYNSAVMFFRSKASSGKVVCAFVWKTSVKKFSKSVHNYTFYTDFSEPLDWRKCAIFKRLYFLNGCIDLDVQYTVGKDMTRSTSWPNFIGKVYHLQGQNIGQTSENSVFGLYYACKAAVSRIYDAWSRRPPASASHCDSCATC